MRNVTAGGNVYFQGCGYSESEVDEQQKRHEEQERKHREEQEKKRQEILDHLEHATMFSRESSLSQVETQSDSFEWIWQTELAGRLQIDAPFFGFAVCQEPESPL